MSSALAIETSTYQLFRLPTQNGSPVEPLSITAGPDGAMWFTGGSANLIGRITATGLTWFFQIPSSVATPFWITAGPDGNLWFTEIAANRIGRLEPASGRITEFIVPSGSSPQTIVAGPDGALWFAENAPRVGRISTRGEITEYPIPAGHGYGYGIAADNGGLWLTQRPAVAVIGRISVSGSITENILPAQHSSPYGIARAANGSIWYTDLGGTLGRIEASGAISVVNIGAFSPVSIAGSPDGAVWVADYGGGCLLRVDESGKTQRFAVPDGTPQAVGIAADRSIWAALPGAHALVRIAQTTASVRRRVVAPPIAPKELPACMPGTVAKAPGSSDVTDFALSNNRVFVTDTGGAVSSIGKNGGSWVNVGQLSGQVTAQIVADDKNVYFLAAPEDASQVNVYSLPKSGGTPVAIATAVANPSNMVADDKYLYLVSTGTAVGEDFLPDGAIVRIRKDGSETLKLVADLSTPYGIAISGGDIFFSEVGFAIGVTRSGVRRVPAAGGAVTTLVDGAISLAVAVDATSVYFDSYDLESEEFAGALRRVPRSGGAAVTLYDGGVMPFDMKVIGDRLYFMEIGMFGGGTIQWIPTGGGTPATVLSADFDVPRFAYDDCNLYYISSDGSVQRTQR